MLGLYASSAHKVDHEMVGIQRNCLRDRKVFEVDRHVHYAKKGNCSRVLLLTCHMWRICPFLPPQIIMEVCIQAALLF